MGRLHVVVLPFPIQGHISPLLQLSQHLVNSHDFIVTFVNTEYNQKAFEEAHPHGAGQGIHMVGLSDGMPLDAPRKSSEDTGKVMQSLPLYMKPQLEQLLSQLNASSNPVSCIIADIFMPWVHSISAAPPLIGFHVSSVSQIAAILRLPHLIFSGQLSPVDGSVNNPQLERVSVLPELLSFESRNLPWCSGNPKEDANLFHFLMIVQKHVPMFRCILLNSFAELEGKVVDALVKEFKMKMLPIGPLLLHDHVSTTPHVNWNGAVQANGRPISTAHDRKCWEWLEAKSKGSVLYISFGTTAWLTEEELHELALGVEAAQVPFMWVLRSDLVMGEAACLPPGFVERTMEKAFFTPWAPQTLVLSHPSVGAFLTHGGWNSAVEAMCMGVPMLTWPYAFDQKGNCQLIVEDWKIGIPLQRRGKAVGKEEMEKLVTCIMQSEEGEQIRKRVGVVQSQARVAFAEGGSSYENLQDFIKFASELATNVASD